MSAIVSISACKSVLSDHHKDRNLMMVLALVFTLETVIVHADSRDETHIRRFLT